MSRHLTDRRIALLNDPPAFEADGVVPYLSTWSLCVPAAPGVYLVSDLRGPLYIGRTTDLRRRFDDHLTASHNRLLAKAIAAPVGETQFRWIVAEGKQQVMLEAYLIYAFMPICNQMLNGKRGSAA